MASWKICAALICTYGFFKAMRPSEPFLSSYLTGPVVNLNSTAVNNQIYPVWTYSYLVALVPVFLLTDLLRYKPVIVFEGFAFIGTWLMLLFGRTVLTMQFMQMLYAICTATEIAYYSYIYAVVDQEHYQKVAGYTRSAILLGKFIAAVLGQVLISLDVTTFYVLNFISLGSVSVAAVFSILLPSVHRSTYFQVGEENTRELRSTNRSEQRVGLQQDGSNDNAAFSSSQNHISSNSSNRALNINPGTNDISRRSQTRKGSTEKGENLEGSLSSSDDVNYRSSYLPFPSAYTGTDIDTSSLAWSIQSDRNSQSSVASTLDGPSESMKTPTDCRANGRVGEGAHAGCCNVVKNAILSLWRDFLATYSKKILLAWSVWWAIASCGNFQVGNYVQNLWDDISPHRDNPHDEYNGAIEAAATLLGAIAAFLVGLIPANWTAYGELALGTVSLLNCALLITMAFTREIWIAYIFYIVFRAAYQLVITIATFQIAKHLEVQRFALVFGLNTFLALLLETIITAIVVDKRGLNLPVTTQFAVNGGYFGIMGLVFFAAAVVNISRRGCVSCRAEDQVPLQEDSM